MNEQEHLTAPEIVKIFKKRTSIDYDAVIAVTGEEGSSKSTLATTLVYEGLLYEKFTPEEALKQIDKRVIYSPNKEVVEKQIKESDRHSIISADEAIKILYKLNWGSSIQKFLNMFFALCRKENKITLLCMPRFTDFNEFFRKHRIKFWIHVIDRGVGVMFARDWNPFTDDPWWMKEGMDIIKGNYRRKKIIDFTTDEKIQMLSKLRNFVGIVRYDDLNDDLKKVYREGKDKYGYEDLDEQTKETFTEGPREAKYKKMLGDSIKLLHKQGLSMEKIAEIIGVSSGTIHKYIHFTLPLEVPININNAESDKILEETIAV
jgi:hypothetical protein